ncbi:MATE family efflux transporter [Actibacterium sp. XHP0104]|uniref:MATE family efflux transporter n=1 Tax=Actibacterium sp. XHP0104 TaxID=2984335 RepID=UPI0021E81D1A|nr:MATE family efflux transporter [Actibacterium sp. XHP0104]MCV2881273.1 MATE family efflux transporter [Actibacterium sp. XHP0104]
MSTTQTYRQHLAATLGLGLPLVGSHLAQYAVTLTDAVMLGWYDVQVLAAQVIAGTLFFVLFLMGSGFAFAVMPMVANAAGAGNDRQVRRVTRMGLWISLGFGLLTLPVFWWSGPILRMAGQEPQIADMAQTYLRICGPAILPALTVMVLKSYLSALEHTRIVLWVTLSAVGLNAAVNYALIFGNWGAPEMGIAGAAVASVSVHLASALGMAAYAIWATPEHALFKRFWRPDFEALAEVFRLGWPIGLTTLAEVGLFGASSLMMGWLGAVPLAAHGIALQIASVVFMIHLGISAAGTVRAGRAIGRGDATGLRRAAIVVTGLSLCMALVTVVVLLTMPEPLVGLFLSPDDPARPAVLALGVSLLAAAALFQIVDAMQVIALGLLRGVQDTRVPMILAAISYWLIGMPVAYLLGFTLDMGGVGVWLGLATGLAVAAVAMMSRFWLWSIRQAAAEAA